MKGYQNRVEALRTLVAGSMVAFTPDYSSIMNELDELYRTRLIRNNRRRFLLQVFHSSRALDSTLKAFTSYHQCSPRNPTLGAHFRVLENHQVANLGKISTQERQHYQNQIVAQRNRYMHEAGAFPHHETEIVTLLAEMHNCLIRVLSL